MSNSVSFASHPSLLPMRMSNGLTSVFVSVLAIAASALASNDRERLIAVWLASHDQGVFGRGVVDFDISEMPWAHDHFLKEKAFVLEVIGAGLSRLGWNKLGYSPQEESVFACLDEFRNMISVLSQEHVDTFAEPNWPCGGPPNEFKLCERHSAYLHSGGCVLCNDE